MGRKQNITEVAANSDIFTSAILELKKAVFFLLLLNKTCYSLTSAILALNKDAAFK